MIYKDLGNIRFQEAWDLQTRLNQQLIDNKRSGGRDMPHYLLFCEHSPVYTLGKSGKKAHLLITDTLREELDIEYFKINRGGDITYHGPGQLTVYPIFDMDRIFTDIHRYVRTLEEIVIRLLETYGIKGSRIPAYTGVWIKDPAGIRHRKICAIGVHLRRWVTMHGLALNVSTNLDYFNHIIPCGISDQNKDVTSISKELGRLVPLDEVKPLLLEQFAEIFQFEYQIDQHKTHYAS